MFRKKSVNLPNTKVFLPPAKAADILFRAAQHPSPFEFVLVDKPQDGTLFIFQTQTAGGQIPDDGYGWMDDEIPHKHMLENGMEVEMFARKQGFVQGDQLCTIQRCRYRLTGNPELNMLHYTKIPNPMTPVNQSLAKTKPRQQVSINQPVPPNYANPIMQMRMQPMTQQQQQLRMQQIQQMQQENLRKKQKLAQAKQVPQVRIIDEEPGFGDEMDHTQGKMACLDRYKRNHLFMEQIFVPVNQNAIQPPKLFQDVSQDRQKLVKEATEQLQKEIQQLKDKHQQEMETAKRRSQTEWRNIRDARLDILS